jgi:hypothetical protein
MRLLLLVACAVRAAASPTATSLSPTDTSYVQERDGALFEARKEGDVAAVRRALDAGANVNAGSPSNHQSAPASDDATRSRATSRVSFEPVRNP